jgi:hypothetical protein
MPLKLERKLKRIAGQKDWSQERKDAFVYGIMRKTGWKPSREKRAEKKMSALLDDLIELAVKPGMVGTSPLGLALTRAKNLRFRSNKNPALLRSEYERFAPHLRDIAKRLTAIGLSRKPDDLIEFEVDPAKAAKAYAAAKAAYDIRRAHSPFQSLSGNTIAPAIKGKTLKRIGIGTGTFGSGLGVGWWLGRRHEERNRELSAKLDDLIELDIGGWRVRRTADLVGPGGRVTGNEYKSEPAPGFGAAVKRNVGKVAFPALGAVTGAALGHAGWGRARPAVSKLKLSGLFEEGEGLTVPSIETAARPASAAPALIGAGVGGLAFLPAGIQADRARQRQAVLSQLLPMAREDYMREKGIRRRPVEMSAKEKPIQFALGIPTDDSTATIMQPFQGATTHESKIDQLEFPAGLSPAAALRFPLPVLMRYLNQRNYLQQQFSWKRERLIQLNAKLDEIHASAHPIQ